MSAHQRSPLSGPPPDEIPLTEAPLVRVIAQVRFPVIASVERRDFIGPFQEQIRREYPVLRPEQSRSVVFGPEGMTDTRETTAWRFHDPHSGWRVTLSPDFVALETDRYSNRDDFLARLERVLRALESHFDPRLIERLGVRYIDRVTGPNLSALPDLVCPQVSGILASPLAGQVVQALSQSVFTLPDGGGFVTARWGQLAARSTIDPTLEAVDTPSWILDLDAYEVHQGLRQAFDVQLIIARARSFAERIYSIFRWVVTDEFLRRYGAPP